MDCFFGLKQKKLIQTNNISINYGSLILKFPEKEEFKEEDINNNAFGKQSVWSYLNNQQHYVVNINLDSPIIATQLHYLEYENKVQYRYMKYFNGSVQNWDNIKSNVKYGYYVRNIKINPTWNRKKILKICQDQKFVLESGPVKFFEWFKLSKFLKKKLCHLKM